ncbi:uncharacterized protein LOC125473159 [Pyrus x bretschneideri]|uniref:uncharacterized protein LOC125473159 n=1 Tax=Pyrus x bretschneideri TaxID=225117 RepID=UPI00202FC5AA|nr:uncharacterized protein LOC125473159 [Pyrus x bretschneideri]
MLRLKGIKDQLIYAGENISDNDYIIAVLSGLPTNFEVIKTVILARDSTMSLKDFRAHLLGVEASIELRMQSLSNSMSAMNVQGNGASSSRFQGGHQNYEHEESSNSQGYNNGSNFQGGSGEQWEQISTKRRGHTTPNCYHRADNNGQYSGFMTYQICGKRAILHLSAIISTISLIKVIHQHLLLLLYLHRPT